MKSKVDLPLHMKGADFSPCDIFRYRLWRRFDPNDYGPDCRNRVVFCLLNPSDGGAILNDPTNERGQRRILSLGYTAVDYVNLFAYRAKYPRDMLAAPDPIGPGNDQAILAATRTAALIICGWGEHGKYRGRAKDVLELLRANGRILHCLEVNKSGNPKHPLYIKYKKKPIRLPHLK